MCEVRISRENRVIVLVAFVFVILSLVIWALVAIPQEYWPLKIVILVIAILIPAGFVAGYPDWGYALNTGTDKN
jgi:hypothetical protein